MAKASNTYNFGVLFPEKLKEWCWELNTPEGRDPYVLTPYSDKKVWWTCNSCGQPYRCRIADKVNKSSGCPNCSSNHKYKSVDQNYNFAVLFPNLLLQWHPTRNAMSPFKLRPSSHTRVYWKCEICGYEWDTKLEDRANYNTGCPACMGRVPTKTNNLLVKFPDIAKTWDYKLNHGERPEDFLPFSGTRVWWICNSNLNHVWSATIASRTSMNSGCPSCSYTYTKLEQFVENKLSMPKLNTSIHLGSKYYKPDFKLSDTLYLNVDGLYWHSHLRKDDSYHFKIREDFESYGLYLLQFREDEIKSHWNVVQSIIDRWLFKVFPINIEECQFVEIQPNDALKFINENSLRTISTSKYLGLAQDGNVVALIAYKVLVDKIKIFFYIEKAGLTVNNGLATLAQMVCIQHNKEAALVDIDLRYEKIQGPFIYKNVTENFDSYEIPKYEKLLVDFNIVGPNTVEIFGAGIAQYEWIKRGMINE